MGLVSARYVLLQHLTKLYVVHLGVVSQEFFYQQVLRRWGSTPRPIGSPTLPTLRPPTPHRQQPSKRSRLCRVAR